jgi:hypothetical protein
MTVPRAGLRQQVEAATAAAVSANPGGIASVSAAAIVKAFMGRGASESSLYRWVRSYLASGAALPRDFPIGETDMPAVAPVSVPPATSMPMAIPGTSVVAPAAVPVPTGIAVLSRLEDCIRAAQQVMDYARKDDGSVRNAKLLIAASEHLRRNLDTAVKLRESMRQDRDLDAFLEDVVREIQKEAPELAQRLLQRLTLRGV